MWSEPVGMETPPCKPGEITNAEVSGFTNNGLGITWAQQQKQSSLFLVS